MKFTISHFVAKFFIAYKRGPNLHVPPKNWSKWDSTFKKAKMKDFSKVKHFANQKIYNKIARKKPTYAQNQSIFIGKKQKLA
jgi:hypothetical protein